MPRLADRLPTLPLPLAQLGYRALNAKSPAEEHNLLVFLAEATVKLAAVARASVWLGADPAPGPVQKALEGLILPSAGHWITIASAADEELGRRKDVAMLPLGECLGRLSEQQAFEAASLLADEALRREVVSKEQASELRRHGLAGFFRFVAAYRNRTVGHGAQRVPAFYAAMALLWRQALAEVLALPELWGEADLAVRKGEDPAAWIRLVDRAGVPDVLPDAERAAESVPPGGVALVEGGRPLWLRGLTLYWRDEVLQSEGVAFLHGAGRGAEDAEDAPRRLHFLDYGAGRVIEAEASAATVAEILSRARGEPVSIASIQDGALAPEEEEEEEAGFSLLASLEAFEQGSTVAGYRVERELARSRTEVLLLATQPAVERTVALKVLRHGVADDMVSRERFRRGLASLARCEHPNIVKVLAADVRREPYHYAMEFVEGADLRRVSAVLAAWRARGVSLRAGHLAAATELAMSAAEDPRAGAESLVPDPPELGSTAGGGFYARVAEIVAGATEGLAHLHRKDALHRDVKPANLLLTRNAARLVLVDFGIAKPTDSSLGLTKTSAKAAGTTRYMAPELLAAHKGAVDVRADVYSMGATLYEVVTGRPLYDAASELELRQSKLLKEPVPVRKASPGVPVELEAVVDHALERDPDRRYASAAELAADLRAFAAGEPLPHARTRGPAGRAWKKLRRSRRALAGFVAAALLLIAGGFAWWAARPETRVEFCQRLLEDKLVPRCLEPSESRPGAPSIRLSYLSGRLQRLSYLDEQGQVTAGTKAPNQGVAELVFEYDSDGNLLRETSLGRRGDLLTDTRYVRVGARPGGGSTVEAVSLGPAGTPRTEPGTDCARRRYELDATGLIEELRFLNTYGAPTTDAQGNRGYRFRRGEGARVTRVAL